jgi:hypothetical protein
VPPRGTTYLTYDDAAYSHPGAVLTRAKAARRDHVGLGICRDPQWLRCIVHAAQQGAPPLPALHGHSPGSGYAHSAVHVALLKAAHLVGPPPATMPWSVGDNPVPEAQKMPNLASGSSNIRSS